MDFIVQTRAQLRRVVDGDTYVMLLDLHNNNFEKGAVTEHIRLNGYGCAEHNTKEGQDAIAMVKMFFGTMSTIIVSLTGKDTFGRYLGDVYLDGVHLGELLLEKGLAHKGNKMGLTRLG